MQQINVKKFPSSKWRWDLNTRPLEHESPPITTRPGLPPYMLKFCQSVEISPNLVTLIKTKLSFFKLLGFTFESLPRPISLVPAITMTRSNLLRCRATFNPGPTDLPLKSRCSSWDQYYKTDFAVTQLA